MYIEMTLYLETGLEMTLTLTQGCVLNLKFIFLPPSPFLIYISSPTEIYYKFSAFFCNFLYFKWIGGKICILFTNYGKNMHFPLFIPSNIFFFPTCYVPMGGGSNRKIYIPLAWPWPGPWTFDHMMCCIMIWILMYNEYAVAVLAETPECWDWHFQQYKLFSYIYRHVYFFMVQKRPLYSL